MVSTCLQGAEQASCTQHVCGLYTLRSTNDHPTSDYDEISDSTENARSAADTDDYEEITTEPPLQMTDNEVPVTSYYNHDISSAHNSNTFFSHHSHR